MWAYRIVKNIDLKDEKKENNDNNQTMQCSTRKNNFWDNLKKTKFADLTCKKSHLILVLSRGKLWLSKEIYIAP